jgi:hypothetical protein
MVLGACGLRLVEIFAEHVPVVRGKSNRGRYDAVFRVERKSNAKTVTADDLVSYVRRLQERYPQHRFYLRRYKNFYVITRKGKYLRDRVSIYVDVGSQRFYVPRSALERNEKLANYVVMVTLGALGVSQSRYEAMLP